MSIAVIPEPKAELSRYRFTVEDYYRMAETGIIPPDARVELIGGEVVTMSPMTSRHQATILRILREMKSIPESKALVISQCPLRLGSRDEPEPDIFLAKPREDDYSTSHPTAKEVLLVIEVAATSQRIDRQVKAPLYARSGVPEYWIFDLKAEALEVHTRPSGGVYTKCRILRAPEGVTPGKLRSFRLELAKVFK